VAAASTFRFPIIQTSVSHTFFLPEPFWLKKISTDPQIPAHINIVCSDDRYPKFIIYISEMVLDSYEFTPTAYVQFFYSPMNAQVSVLRTILKFTFK
jgi:hypothetical protein